MKSDKSKEAPYASYTVLFYENSVDCKMHGFERLNHGAIERSMRFVFEKWSSLQQKAVRAQRDVEAKARQEKETEDA